MTVCIAVIYNGNSILGASDRMLTSGGVGFEPSQSKIISITGSIVAMIAGDSSVQARIYTRAIEILKKKLEPNPDKWLSVEDVANTYSEVFLKLNAETAEKLFLFPHNLTHETFLARQKEMDPKFIETLKSELSGQHLSVVETIIAGIDDTGPHIFVVRNGLVDSADMVGFAAIGSGAQHAFSHLMFNGHTRNTLESKALLTLHQAKKKSEVVATVGSETDMFQMGPNPGTLKLLEQPTFPIPIVKDLDAFYVKYKKEIEKLDRKTEKVIKDYLASLSAPIVPKQEISSSPSPSPSPEAPEREEEKHTKSSMRSRKK